MSKGGLYIYHGEGHGKSTAAIGGAVKAACEGQEAIVIQFLKGKDNATLDYIGRLEPEVKFFNFSRAEIYFNDLDEDSKLEEIMNIKNGFNYAKKVVSTKTEGTVVLDEILGILDMHLVTLEDVIELINLRAPEVTLIFTGRVLCDELREYADEICLITQEK